MRRVIVYLRVSTVTQNNDKFFAAVQEQYPAAENVEKEGMTVGEANTF